ncbi:hypothetical protein ID866_11453 [Astraeus odoratus]|nr:hypothetical protein ID866_11453 [Astraeus odoratus]
MQVRLSLAHLIHTDMLIQLLLSWTFESAHCHFLASAAVAITHQYLYQHLTMQYAPHFLSLTSCFHFSSASCST